MSGAPVSPLSDLGMGGWGGGDDRPAGLNGAEGMIDGLAKFNARSVTVAQSVSTLKRDG